MIFNDISFIFAFAPLDCRHFTVNPGGVELTCLQYLLFPYSELVSSNDHHKPYDIKPSVNNYSISKKNIYNSQSEQMQIKFLSRS